MRLFSAIPLPDNLKHTVAEITRGRLPVPYVNTDNLHVTLNFFDELDTDDSKMLLEIFPQPVDGKKGFAVEFDKVAKFRNQIHVTLKPNRALKQLHAEMADYYQERGFRLQDREYYPHMKLANMHMDKVMHPGRKLENFPNAELSKLNFVADKVVLYESKLLLHHAHHTPVAEVKLA